MSINRYSPEGQFLKFIWNTTASIAEPVADLYKWTLSGIAAILALVIANIDSVASSIASANLKWGIIGLVLSLLLGVFAHNLAVAVKFRRELGEHIDTTLTTEEGVEVIKRMECDPRILIEHLSAPYFGPLKWLTKRAGEKGLADQLSSEKGTITLMCTQVYIGFCHYLLGAIGIIVLASGVE
jgi:hypothetical protein